MDNRRRSSRIPTKLAVRWVRKGYSVETEARDVSREGLFLSTTDAEPGTLMQIEVLLPSGPVRMVVNPRFVGRTQNGSGSGVEIYHFRDGDRARWLEYYDGLLATVVTLLRAPSDAA